MTLISYPLLEAAKLVACSYDPDANPTFKKLIKKEKKGDARAYLLTNNFLIIPGSDSFADYAKYNLRLIGVGQKKLKVSTATTRDDKGHNWHQGFLRHSNEIQAWLGDRVPDMIIGHSLGAATTQVLSMSLKVSGIAFAPPRPYKGRSPVHSSKYCLNICRVDDPVCNVPRGFSHIGKAIYLTPKSGKGVFRHKMHYYMKALQKNTTPKKVPGRWKS